MKTVTTLRSGKRKFRIELIPKADSGVGVEWVGKFVDAAIMPHADDLEYISAGMKFEMPKSVIVYLQRTNPNGPDIEIKFDEPVLCKCMQGNVKDVVEIKKLHGSVSYSPLTPLAPFHSLPDVDFIETNNHEDESVPLVKSIWSSLEDDEKETVSLLPRPFLNCLGKILHGTIRSIPKPGISTKVKCKDNSGKVFSGVIIGKQPIGLDIGDAIKLSLLNSDTHASACWFSFAGVDQEIGINSLSILSPAEWQLYGRCLDVNICSKCGTTFDKDTKPVLACLACSSLCCGNIKCANKMHFCSPGMSMPGAPVTSIIRFAQINQELTNSREISLSLNDHFPANTSSLYFQYVKSGIEIPKDQWIYCAEHLCEKPGDFATFTDNKNSYVAARITNSGYVPYELNIAQMYRKRGDDHFTDFIKCSKQYTFMSDLKMAQENSEQWLSTETQLQIKRIAKDTSLTTKQMCRKITAMTLDPTLGAFTFLNLIKNQEKYGHKSSGNQISNALFQSYLPIENRKNLILYQLIHILRDDE